MKRTGILGVFLVGALGVASGSCVVTYEPQFQNPGACPPFFVTQNATPSVATISIKDPTQPSPDQQNFDASVAIESCAVATTYQGRVFIDGQSSGNPPDFTFDPPNDGTAKKSFRVVLAGTVGDGCHRIELYASSAFAPGDPRSPATPGDLAYISWFVDVRSAGSSHTTGECNP